MCTSHNEYILKNGQFLPRILLHLICAQDLVFHIQIFFAIILHYDLMYIYLCGFYYLNSIMRILLYDWIVEFYPAGAIS